MKDRGKKNVFKVSSTNSTSRKSLSRGTIKTNCSSAEKLSGITQVNPKLPQPDSTQAKEIPERGKSIWQIAEDFVKDIPEEELSKLPLDGAEQHDHYIYGTPKIEA